MSVFPWSISDFPSKILPPNSLDSKIQTPVTSHSNEAQTFYRSNDNYTCMGIGFWALSINIHFLSNFSYQLGMNCMLSNRNWHRVHRKCSLFEKEQVHENFIIYINLTSENQVAMRHSYGVYELVKPLVCVMWDPFWTCLIIDWAI